MPKNSMQANAALPVAYQGTLRWGWAIALMEAAMVLIVSVAVAAVVPEILTGDVVPKLSVGGF
jgi:hypothetical protein